MPSSCRSRDLGNELVPGVFLSPFGVVINDGNPDDEVNDVVCWSPEEWAEDIEAVFATLTAVALATKYGPASVRRNIEQPGSELRRLLRDTAKEMGNI